MLLQLCCYLLKPSHCCMESIVNVAAAHVNMLHTSTASMVVSTVLTVHLYTYCESCCPRCASDVLAAATVSDDAAHVSMLHISTASMVY